MMKGWISLHRKIFDNPVLKFSRRFSTFEAWLWLLLNANHKERKVVLGSTLYKVHKGSMITSQKKLCKEFGWGNSRLRSFLRLLQEDDMVAVKTNQNLTQITLLNYGSYQDSKSLPNHKQITTKSLLNTNNNANNDNNDNNVNARKQFSDWYILYNKMVGRLKAEKYFINKINTEEIPNIMEHTKGYVLANPKQFRKDPYSYLYNQTWKDEIISTTEFDIKQFKLDSTGYNYMGYCSKCNVSGFYKKEQLSGDSTCCNDKIKPKK